MGLSGSAASLDRKLNKKRNFLPLKSVVNPDVVTFVDFKIVSLQTNFRCGSPRRIRRRKKHFLASKENVTSTS